MKIRVLFFVSTLESGGPTNVIFNIIKYLNREIIDPIVVTLSPEPLRTRQGDFEKMDVAIFKFNQSRLSWMFSGGEKLRAFIDETKPHIIHSHSLRPDVFSAKHLNAYIRLSTIHANLQDNYRNTYNRIVGDYFAYTQIKQVNHLEKAVACARSVYEVYKNNIRSLGFIPNGVDHEIFIPLSAENILKRRQKLGIATDRKIFITVGSLCARKDPHTVIKGFLKSDFAQESLLLVLGTGELEEELRTTYAKFPNVVFKGFIQEVVRYIEVADYFLSASLSEGLPNTVLEALSCGLPVCLSDIPAHKEILDIDSGAGITFSCGDIAGLSDAINTLAKKDYSLLRSAATGIIETALSARKMSAKYQELYISLYQEYASKKFNNT
ncbi:glycosyltransferase family 4 protein [Ohtaekwangia sp.]|uniref:glycosyltransferase family 4 protein n=1 Tax=Ohtaekwangia sp. TaxID=2066019 RepID=UPI002FDD3704